MAVHSTDFYQCSYKGCTKKFKHCKNFLEHMNWSHRKTKDVPCTNCDKYFQTPSSMRAHRIHKHGYVPELVPGHPLAPTYNNKCRSTADATLLQHRNQGNKCLLTVFACLFVVKVHRFKCSSAKCHDVPHENCKWTICKIFLFLIIRYLQ